MRKSLAQGKDVCLAMEWIEKNRDKFVGKVYMPMLLLVRNVFDVFRTSCSYSEDLNTGLVWYSNGQKKPDNQIVFFFGGGTIFSLHPSYKRALRCGGDLPPGLGAQTRPFDLCARKL